MSDAGSQKPVTTNELYVLIITVFVLSMIFAFANSCTARYRYLDLRNRLERIEQQVRR